MAGAGTSRRRFCSGAACYSGAALVLSRGRLMRAAADGFGVAAQAQVQAGSGGTATRPDVAAIDHDRILAAAGRYLTLNPAPLTSLPCPRSPGTVHDYYSEAEASAAVETAGAKPAAGDSTAKVSAGAPAFTAHRDAVFELGLQAPALAAAYLLTGDAKYAEHAVVQLRAWFVDPDTKMTPRMDYGQVSTAPVKEHTTIQNNAEFGRRVDSSARVGGSSAGIVETLPLVEVAQAIPFLAASEAMTDADLSGLHAWFAAYLRWLTEPQDSGPRLAALARDRKDHHGTSWLLQVSAYSLLTAAENGAPKSESNGMDELRHRFKTVALRAQVSPDGMFPHELPSATPYRDSLFNLDMMAAICNLLSTRFESLWDYQLEDGPSMRGAIAYHFPFIADRSNWPFRADIAHFNELPGRRASLLFSARAYQRPEYAALWKTLPPDPPTPEVLRTIPIHQPLLWVRQPKRREG
jgi:Alginate lyase